jgi:formylglycine-generating enzyme required for sulfatase activity
MLNSPADNPTGLLEASPQVDRGGGWRSIPRGCRSAIRIRDTSDIRFNYLGFRLALVPSGG